jgi:hypothetical protein
VGSTAARGAEEAVRPRRNPVLDHCTVDRFLLEDNVRMTKAMCNLGLAQIPGYRVYEMPI